MYIIDAGEMVNGFVAVAMTCGIVIKVSVPSDLTPSRANMSLLMFADSETHADAM